MAQTEFYVSDDGTDFGQPVKKGVIEAGSDKKTVTFEPVKCRFIKLKAISEVNGEAWTSAAEIGVVPDNQNLTATAVVQNGLAPRSFGGSGFEKSRR